MPRKTKREETMQVMKNEKTKHTGNHWGYDEGRRRRRRQAHIIGHKERNDKDLTQGDKESNKQREKEKASA